MKTILRAFFLIFIPILFFSSALSAQLSIRFEIKKVPDSTPKDAALYVAGNFNGWNPKEEKYRFQKDDRGNYFLPINLPSGTIEYKITRGGWDKVECSKKGTPVANRRGMIQKDTSIAMEVAEWADNFTAEPKQTTASPRVRVLAEDFFIPQLNRSRKIWVYLPAGYGENKKTKYPVLYMHDGQNVFDEATAFSGEWGVDEFMDSTEFSKCIVVGIANGDEHRLTEYNVHDHPKFGKGEGAAYLEFIVKTLKPHIDKRFRTKRDKESTFIAGSSMGGLISMYAILRYPKVFGAAGVFSPSFAVSPQIFEEIKVNGSKVKGRIFFFAGKQEGERMVPDMLKAFEQMAAVSKAKMETVIRDEGRHEESTWRHEFPGFYRWLME